MGSDDPGRQVVSRRTALKTLGAVGVLATGASGTALGQEGSRGTQQQDGQEGSGGTQQQDSVADARAATVRLDVTGDFNFPDIGQVDVRSGGGSGFLISPDGVVLTANHVVNGADSITAYVGEDRQRAYRARVIGRSDCSDLAVVQLQGAGFSTLSFRNEPVAPGTPVTAHGFPLGLPLSTTFGRISATGLDGNTDWASVSTVLSHSAGIAPGSSGGPLVDDQGQVVGMNYAGSSLYNVNLAVGAADIVAELDTLRQADAPDWFGINGVAVETPTPMTAGGVDRAIHVVSVNNDSPAFDVGLEPGDRILRINGTLAVTPASDEQFPTKSAYCSLMFSNAAGRFTIQVHREQIDGSSVVLEGRVRGEPLSVVEGQAPGGAYTFVPVSNAAGTISAELPTEWTDVRDGDLADGPFLAASPDVDGFTQTWTVPGAFIVATDRRGTDTNAVLEGLSTNVCGTPSRSDYTNAQFAGSVERLEGCPEGASLVNFAALTGDRSFMVYGQVQLVDDRDEEALSRLLGSLSVQGFPGTGGDGGGNGGDGGGGGGRGGNGGGDGGDGDGSPASLAEWLPGR
ncbi:trypsin-like peptidase domain-containing protein [Halobaculum rarum]|uniref:trypsin-like peptidase domain-containing protein n=1 Tax=Halobaculum rarum TaxID=3075122 RepID=UPI0032AE9799